MNTYKYRTGSGDIISFYSENNLNSYSISDIKQILQRSIVRPRFRIHILNEDETVREIIPNQNIIKGGNYSENYQNGQRRTLNFSLQNAEKLYLPSINQFWAGTKFSLEVGIELDNKNIIWFKKGIYSLLSANPTHSPGVKTVAFELGDKFAILQGKEGTFDTSVTFPAGTLIEDVIRDLLLYDKGNGEVLDPKPFIYHSSFKGKTLQATITKEAGGTIGEVLLEIADMISAEVFYNTEGYLTWEPKVESMNDIDKPIIYDLFVNKGEVNTEDFSLDFGEIVNKIMVVGGTINGKTCRATALNDNASSPLCYQRIGYRTTLINDSNITSDSLAQERADYELRQVSILRTTNSVPTFFNPLMTVNNLITITDNYFELKQTKFLIQGVSFSLDYNNSVTLSCSNVENLPFIM